VADTDDSCQKGDLEWQSYNETDSDADGCQDETEDIDYGDSEENNESGIDCNPYLTTCEDDEEEEDSNSDTTSSEESVQSMILGLLAMALVPTGLGALLIAYRIQW
jgi:hypothetical protein